MLATAFDRAVKTAYKAVMKPRGGRSLRLQELLRKKRPSFVKRYISERLFNEILRYAEEVLTQTRNASCFERSGCCRFRRTGPGVLAGALDAFTGKRRRACSGGRCGDGRSEPAGRRIDDLERILAKSNSVTVQNLSLNLIRRCGK